MLSNRNYLSESVFDGMTPSHVGGMCTNTKTYKREIRKEGPRLKMTESELLCSFAFSGSTGFEQCERGRRAFGDLIAAMLHF